MTFIDDRIARKLQSHRTSSTAARPTGTAKAGKRRGGITPPPEPSDDNLSRRIMGEQQFVAKRFPKMACSCCPLKRGKPAGCAYDSGLRWDEHRKQIILPPKMAAKQAEVAA